MQSRAANEDMRLSLWWSNKMGKIVENKCCQTMFVSCLGACSEMPYVSKMQNETEKVLSTSYNNHTETLHVTYCLDVHPIQDPLFLCLFTFKYCSRMESSNDVILLNAIFRKWTCAASMHGKVVMPHLLIRLPSLIWFPIAKMLWLFFCDILTFKPKADPDESLARLNANNHIIWLC